jgi:hypothetical protein
VSHGTRKRTCPVFRPIVPTPGGRSLANVPRPHRLLARQRGGSAGSLCSIPFFPRVLEHLVAFGFQIRQWGIWL